MDRRKELKLAYKMNTYPMGVYQLKNTVNGKILVGGSMNLPGSSNSVIFQLKMKSHLNQVLQDEWDTYGADAFTFEVLATIDTDDIPEEDWRRAVANLEKQWLNSLQPYGERGYNKEKP